PAADRVGSPPVRPGPGGAPASSYAGRGRHSSRIGHPVLFRIAAQLLDLLVQLRMGVPAEGQEHDADAGKGGVDHSGLDLARLPATFGEDQKPARIPLGYERVNAEHRPPQRDIDHAPPVGATVMEKGAACIEPYARMFSLLDHELIPPLQFMASTLPGASTLPAVIGSYSEPTCRRGKAQITDFSRPDAVPRACPRLRPNCSVLLKFYTLHSQIFTNSLVGLQ